MLVDDAVAKLSTVQAPPAVGLPRQVGIDVAAWLTRHQAPTAVTPQLGGRRAGAACGMILQVASIDLARGQSIFIQETSHGRETHSLPHRMTPHPRGHLHSDGEADRQKADAGGASRSAGPLRPRTAPDDAVTRTTPPAAPTTFCGRRAVFARPIPPLQPNLTNRRLSSQILRTQSIHRPALPWDR